MQTFNFLESGLLLACGDRPGSKNRYSVFRFRNRTAGTSLEIEVG
jgi:hypothetical protein